MMVAANAAADVVTSTCQALHWALHTVNSHNSYDAGTVIPFYR